MRYLETTAATPIHHVFCTLGLRRSFQGFNGLVFFQSRVVFNQLVQCTIKRRCLIRSKTLRKLNPIRCYTLAFGTCDSARILIVDHLL